VAEGAPPPPTAPPPAPTRKDRLILAVAVGLCGALALGGVWLLWSGSRTANKPPACAELSSEECALEEDIAQAWAKRQVSLGAILMFAGGAMSLTLWLTERHRAAQE
jgi:hypothetical protein